MIPTAFEYFAPKSLDEALRLVERHGDEAKLLAGGHSLLPLMKLRLSVPRYVIDIGRIKSLRSIREDAGALVIGALTTHHDMETSELVGSRCPLLAETAAEIGDVQVRNRGTVGGSLAHGDPAADYPAAMVALDAEIVVAASSGTRRIRAEDFFVDLLTTQLRPGEIVTEVRVPASPEMSGSAYCKLHQPASGFALVGAAAQIALDSNGKLASVAIGMTGVAVRAYRARAAEAVLAGNKPSGKLLAEAAEKVADGIEPLADLHASAAYRRAVASVYARRALETAISRANERKA
ncbi:MAG TPA: xanthine dehydrogenase family protein subunit M [Candidatus Dormibacteraeota bacterium]|nr:xanthine dehydrogenase family protein subunit M [Candidatus Dormibacteraeota bacterium]